MLHKIYIYIGIWALVCTYLHNTMCFYNLNETCAPFPQFGITYPHAVIHTPFLSSKTIRFFNKRFSTFPLCSFTSYVVGDQHASLDVTSWMLHLQQCSSMINIEHRFYEQDLHFMFKKLGYDYYTFNIGHIHGGLSVHK